MLFDKNFHKTAVIKYPVLPVAIAVVFRVTDRYVSSSLFDVCINTILLFSLVYVITLYDRTCFCGPSLLF